MKLKRAVWVALLALITACGGGGSGDATNSGGTSGPKLNWDGGNWNNVVWG